MRNLTLIKCTQGYPMSMVEGISVFGVVPGHRAAIVERKRFVTNLTAARVQTIDLPSIVSAPPPERRT